MDWLADIGAWAWARHHNEWSWYIRPLFLVPYCWFAWRRSLAGLVLTLVALLTSMAWFPPPEALSPMVVSALAAERAYLLGPWGWQKIAVALLVPASLVALALAFWRRSFAWGIAVVNAMALTKIGWSFVVFERGAALHHLVPALVGLAVCDVLLVGAMLVARRRR